MNAVAVCVALAGLVACATALGLLWRARTGRVRTTANDTVAIDVSEIAPDAVAGSSATRGVVRARIGGTPRPAEIAEELGRIPFGLVIPAALAFVAAFLNSVFDYCFGCQIYLLLVRARILGRAPTSVS